MRQAPQPQAYPGQGRQITGISPPVTVRKATQQSRFTEQSAVCSSDGLIEILATNDNAVINFLLFLSAML